MVKKGNSDQAHSFVRKVTIQTIPFYLMTTKVFKQIQVSVPVSKRALKFIQKVYGQTSLKAIIKTWVAFAFVTGADIFIRGPRGVCDVTSNGAYVVIGFAESRCPCRKWQEIDFGFQKESYGVILNFSQRHLSLQTSLHGWKSLIVLYFVDRCFGAGFFIPNRFVA